MGVAGAGPTWVPLPVLLLPRQIQEPLSPQEPPRPLEGRESSPDSGELSPPPPTPQPHWHPDPVPPLGKQLVHYTAQPLLLLDPGLRTGSSDLPVLFELGEGSYFSEGDDYSDDPTISPADGLRAPPKPRTPLSPRSPRRQSQPWAGLVVGEPGPLAGGVVAPSQHRGPSPVSHSSPGLHGHTQTDQDAGVQNCILDLHESPFPLP